ncbi:hypothetical protein A4R35_23250 [Thermogemmatispora tikiterensis]|uniref:Right handed beta helix domain-containing protein n=1 Tax=Thermogemmatispora tikiterensis TaxID=1825093 RepID=A0A328VKP3_9CHLR|nr:hypothetical protein A4R35_23250 [Thermogemmatispora tikiterensis]
MRKRPGQLLLVLVTVLLPCSALTAVAEARALTDLTCGSGQTLLISQTIYMHRLTVAQGCTLAAPDGYSLTLTVNGIETGQRLTATGGAATAIQPGTYRGDVVLTVAQANAISWQGLLFPFRQALYVDNSGIVRARSVLAALLGGVLTATTASNVRLVSTGEAFNGIYVAGGSYLLEHPMISFQGNGRSDFVGYGAAIVGTGEGTRLVVDHAFINNSGAVRTAVVAEGGANVIVKNSTIAVRDGILPADYVPTVDLAYMESAPWMLSIAGNVRATNLLGVNTKATYINSTLSSEGWGVLSSDVGQDGQLTAINSTLINTGSEGGYGSYAIGDAVERFLGTTFDVATYASIIRGGTVFYGDSTPTAVAQLNSALDLGLSAHELAQLPVRATVINSRRFGVMWHGPGAVTVTGGTLFRTQEATFLDKGQAVTITVDGSQGARLLPANGTLLQLMENDDPGPVMVNGKLVNAGVYTEPSGLPVKDSSFDVTAVHSSDAVATFSQIALTGNFFNGMRGDMNMVLTFNKARLTGVISASLARHAVSTITSAHYQQLGEVSNTPSPVINNGVIVTLNAGSGWTVTGTSYLSKLVLAPGATLTAPAGHTLALTVDGVPTPIVSGQSYSGNIVLAVR